LRKIEAFKTQLTDIYEINNNKTDLSEENVLETSTIIEFLRSPIFHAGLTSHEEVIDVGNKDMNNMDCLIKMFDGVDNLFIEDCNNVCEIIHKKNRQKNMNMMRLKDIGKTLGFRMQKNTFFV